MKSKNSYLVVGIALSILAYILLTRREGLENPPQLNLVDGKLEFDPKQIPKAPIPPVAPITTPANNVIPITITANGASFSGYLPMSQPQTYPAVGSFGPYSNGNTNVTGSTIPAKTVSPEPVSTPKKA
jgi:hypothetical protein